MKEAPMKDKYEWKDVTRECELVWHGTDPNCHYLELRHDGIWVASVHRNGVQGEPVSEYRLTHDARAIISFRIERRVEVEQPREVYLRVWSKDMGGECLSSKTISYRSAVELGLIEAAK